MNSADTYQVEALLELATVFPRSLTAAAIAGRRKIPRAFLARLLRTLSESGLVASTRGPAGGVRLARPPGEITLDAVLPVRSRPHGARGGSAVAYLFERLAAARRDTLASISLGSLRDLERRLATTEDWQI